MAVKKRKPATRAKKRVSGVTTTVKKKTIRKKSVGAIVDRHLFYLAAGMSAQSIVEQMLINPLRARIPKQFAMVADPAQALLSYAGMKKFKHPFIQGVLMGTMKQGVDGTVKLILGKMPMERSNVGDTYELPMPNLGEIKNYLSGIPESMGDVGNSASFPAMGNPLNIGEPDPGDEIILPLGYDK